MFIVLFFLACFATPPNIETPQKEVPVKKIQKIELERILSSFQGDEFTSQGLRKNIFSKALRAFEIAAKKGEMQYSTVSIADFTLHSSKKRLWTIDLNTKTVLFHTVVSHGKGSDSDHDGMLNTVSNIPQSKQSSVGLYKTAETYVGKHGYSLKMDGLEKAHNDNARKRAIVIHGAEYTRESFVKKHGKAGRSFGCPAISDTISKEFINTIKGGTLYWIYANDKNWLSKSTFLQ